MKKIQYPTTSNDSGLLAFRKDSVIDITDPITTMMVAYRRLRMVVTLLLETTHDRFILIAVCYIPQVLKNRIYIHVFCELFFFLFVYFSISIQQKAPCRKIQNNAFIYVSNNFLPMPCIGNKLYVMYELVLQTVKSNNLFLIDNLSISKTKPIVY